MASVTITIPNTNWLTFSSTILRWRPTSPSSHISLGMSLSVGGGTELFLGELVFPLGTRTVFDVQLSTGTEASQDPGPEFTDQMEASGTITCTASDDSTLVITGIGDATEPYRWSPSNLDAVRSFGSNLNSLADRTLIVTFNDNAEVRDFYRRSAGSYSPAILYRRTGGAYSEVAVYRRQGGTYQQVSGPV